MVRISSLIKHLDQLVSDKIIITGDMIAGAISANTANIGGIHMGMGQVWSEAKNGNGTPKFRLDGVNGTLYASDADISGTIHAKSLILVKLSGIDAETEILDSTCKG